MITEQGERDGSDVSADLFWDGGFGKLRFADRAESLLFACIHECRDVQSFCRRFFALNFQQRSLS